VIPTLPLRLRNRLAETILAALHDAAARRELAALSAADAAARWLGDDEARWAAPLAERARGACAALAGRALHGARADLAQALEDAAALFDAGLHFEVHELLEPHWATSEGETREALQGLIQAAVGFQHLANGNVAGARSLLIDAGGRLHGRALLGRDLEPFARAAGQAAARIAAGQAVSAPAFPR
jgi:predicted metal-dependent hydrolase